MKRLTVRMAIIAALVLVFAGLIAPVSASAANGVTEQVTFEIYDNSNTLVTTVTTQEYRNGAIATGTWSNTNGGQGTLWAYHYPDGLFATVQQTTNPTGRAVITLTGSLGTFWYSMDSGQYGMLVFTATSPETNVWVVHLLGPVPPIFFSGNS